ncbi:flagellar biosynthesis anti-sigma factor FlgM [Sphingomonas sp. VNH70]|uniref:flagellar biosynthesis anti-sigma factor FlgM n=1 Tax=Sphingomonas silueang TaxID=3156617 RepID=UPI0032B560BD
MVEPIGNRPISSTGPRAVARAQAPSPVAAATSGDAPPVRTDKVEAARTAAALSESPPVNLDRVAQVRRAIEEGRFPISPATIADSLIALKLDWIDREPS